jgi:hypothetical protein
VSDATSPTPSGDPRAAEPRPSAVASGNPYATPRVIGRVIATVGLLFGAGNALRQAWGEASDILTRAHEPLVSVFAFQSAIAVLGAAAAFGVWKRARWSAKMTLAWGITSATFVASLDFLLDLGAEARGGLLVGATIVLALAAAIARFAKRDQRDDETQRHVDALMSPVPSSQAAARDVISDRQQY